MGKGNRGLHDTNPDYLMQGTKSTVVLMTDKELLEILDIMKDIVNQADHEPQNTLNKIDKLEKKFKTNK